MDVNSTRVTASQTRGHQYILGFSTITIVNRLRARTRNVVEWIQRMTESSVEIEKETEMSRHCRTWVLLCGIVTVTLAGAATTTSKTALGQTQPTQQLAQPPASTATQGAGTVDIAKSRVYIFVGKTGFGHDHGVEGRLKSGSVKLGAAQQAGQLVFDMRSFDADTPAARRYVGLGGTTDASTRSQVNANMKGAAVLNVQRFPTATFEIQSARQLQQKSRSGHPMYQLTGEFALHGVKRKLQFNAEGSPEEGFTRLRGNFVIRQTQFGITPFSKAFGAVGVADALRIYGDIIIPTETAVPAQGSGIAAQAESKGAQK